MRPIILCNSETCPFKKYCYRSSAIPQTGQSYANLEEFEEENYGKCANFLCNYVYTKLNSKEERR